MAEVPRVEGTGGINLAPGQTTVVAVAVATAIREDLMVGAAVRVSQHDNLCLCVLVCRAPSAWRSGRMIYCHAKPPISLLQHAQLRVW